MSGSQQESYGQRSVRSYVLREGRMTPAQERALKQWWPRYGVETKGEPLDLDALFGRHAPRVLEIGFGRGDTLLALAEDQPGHDFLGVEVHRPGIGHLLNGVAERGLTNVRVCRADAAELLEQGLPDAAFDSVLVLFPDPWPKKRHHKRRLLTRATLERVSAKIVEGGRLLVATDSESYAEQIRIALHGVAELRPDPRAVARRFRTRYEHRAERHGNQVREFALRVSRSQTD